MDACVFMMGVSGSGKSATGRAIAERLGWTFIEGDDLHPQGNIGTSCGLREPPDFSISTAASLK